MPYEYGGYDLSRMYPVSGVRGVTIYTNLLAHATGIGAPVYPHHPIQCPDPHTWDWNGDDDFACQHAKVPNSDERLQAAVTFSIATLIIELGSKL